MNFELTKFWINTLLCTTVLLLHYILKCNQFGMKIVRVFVEISSNPDEKLFSETAVGETIHTLFKLYGFPVGFLAFTFLKQCIALYAVAEGWLLLDIE